MNPDPHVFHSSAQSNGRLHLTFQVKLPALSPSDNRCSDVSRSLDGDMISHAGLKEKTNGQEKLLSLLSKLASEGLSFFPLSKAVSKGYFKDYFYFVRLQDNYCVGLFKILEQSDVVTCLHQ